MLTVLRKVLPAVTVEAAVFGWGSAEVGAGDVGGRNVAAEGARSPLLGVFGADLLDAGVWIPPVLFLVLPTGRAGRAAVGGPFEGLETLGRAVAISACVVASI